MNRFGMPMQHFIVLYKYINGHLQSNMECVCVCKRERKRERERERLYTFHELMSMLIFSDKTVNDSLLSYVL